MFSFNITPLGNLFFGLSLLVFITLFLVKNHNRYNNMFFHTLLLISLAIIFYANSFLTLFIGWEIMGWSSFFILSSTASVKTAQKYIVFNIAGAFSFLGAIILIYGFSGSFIFNEIDFGSIPNLYSFIISILFLITIFIKSGVIPFHYWIVDSYNEADDIFSVILSAIISKAGIYLFIIVFFTMMKLDVNLTLIVAWAGAITSIIATYKAITQDDIKKLLAYSSIAQLGYIITVISFVNNSALEAALYHTIIHTLVKLLLFVNIASIIYITGKTKFSNLGGLLYKYPLSFVLLTIGIITLAGMPPLGGWNSKFLIYTTLLEQKQGVLLAAVMFSSASAFLYCYKLVYGIYLGQETSNEEYKKIPISFYIPQIVATIIIVILGVIPSSIVPFLNTILDFVSLQSVTFINIYELNTQIASFNGAIVMATFAIIFIIILLLFLRLKNKTLNAKNRYDISYCGEEPKENVNLHYGYGMGQELARIDFIKIILKNSSKNLWNTIDTIFKNSSDVLQKFYALGIQNIAFLIVLFFAILLAYGVLV